MGTEFEEALEELADQIVYYMPEQHEVKNLQEQTEWIMELLRDLVDPQKIIHWHTRKCAREAGGHRRTGRPEPRQERWLTLSLRHRT